MYHKILAKLQAKYAGLPLSFLGLIAKQLEAKVTAEDGIDQAITDFDNVTSIKTLGEEFQKEGDRRVTDAKKKWDEENPKPPTPPAPGPNPPNPNQPANPNEAPEWAKGLMKEIADLRAEKAMGTIKEQAAAKLKDIPASFWAKRALPQKVEDLEAFIVDVTADWTTFKQEQINAGLMTADKPAGGGGSGNGVSVADKVAEADIDGWAKNAEPKKS